MEPEIIARLRLDTSEFDASLIQAAQRAGGVDLANAVSEQNTQLRNQAALFSAITQEERRLAATQRDLNKVRGSELEAELNKRIAEGTELLKELRQAYAALGREAGAALGEVAEQSDKATESSISLSSALAAGIGLSLVDTINTIVSSIGQFISSSTSLAIANEEVADGQESTNDKIQEFEGILEDIQILVGNTVLPALRGLLDLTNSIGQSFLDIFNPVQAATDAYIEQGLAVSDLETNITPLIEVYDNLSSQSELTTSQQNDLERAMQGIAEAVPSAITEIDEYGNVLAISTENAEAFIGAQRRLLQARNADLIREQTEQLESLTREQTRLNFEIENGRIISNRAGNEFIPLTAEQREAAILALQAVGEQALETRAAIALLSGSFEDFLAAQPNNGNITGTIAEQISQLELSLERAQAARDEIIIGPEGFAEAERLDSAIQIIQDRIAFLRGQEVNVRTSTNAPETQRIIEGTVAFLRQQVSELEQELEFVIPIDDIATRQRFREDIARINAEILRIENLFSIPVTPDLTQLNEDLQEQIELAEIPPIEVDVRLNVPDGEQVVEAVEATSDEIEKRLAARNLQIINLEQLTEDLSTANDITSLALNSIGGLFDTLAENRIASENLSDTEIAEIRRRQFEREKAFAATSAVLQGSLTVLKFAAQLGPIGAAAAALLVGIQTAAILAQEPPAFKDGVFDLGNRDSYMSIPGPGTTTSDSIAARLSRGETVISARRTRDNYDILKAIDEGKTIAPYISPTGETYFAPKPLMPIAMPARLKANENPNRRNIDYKKLGQSVAREMEKIVSSKSNGQQMESALHRFNEYKERKGFQYGRESEDILLEILKGINKMANR